jgi:hypothetical protein
MAFYIRIEKLSDDDHKATYRFIGDGDLHGIFTITKNLGELNLIEGMPGDTDQGVYRRASIKILREWRNGNLPEFTEWAS